MEQKGGLKIICLMFKDDLEGKNNYMSYSGGLQHMCD